MLRVLSPDEVKAHKSTAPLFQLTEDFAFTSSAFGRIVVSTGFVTDFASIPTWAQFWMDDDAPEILFGSVIHDFIYANLGITPERQFSRAEADAVLREAMLDCGASSLRANIVYNAVRVGGSSHWKQ